MVKAFIGTNNDSYEDQFPNAIWPLSPSMATDDNQIASLRY
jgi:hypothetical protein